MDLAYFLGDDGKLSLIDVVDAEQMIQDGISLRGRLFDVRSYAVGRRVLLKFVNSCKSNAYFATRQPDNIQNELDSTKPERLLVMSAVKMLQEDYRGIRFGIFGVAREFITDIGVGREFCCRGLDGITYIVRPDIVVSTPFLEFFINFVTDCTGSEGYLDIYRKYYRYGNHNLPFMVVNVCIGDLVESVRLRGCGVVQEELRNRLFVPTQYQECINMLVEPFGYSARTGEPWKLVVNTYADTISNDLRQFMVGKDNIRVTSLETDGLHSLFLTDDSPEHPLYPLCCPKHPESPLRIARQAKGYKKVFFKCDKSEDGVDTCGFTVTYYSTCGLADEYIVLGGLGNLLHGDVGAASRIEALRKCQRAYERN